MTPPGYENRTSTPWRRSASQTTSAPIRVRFRGLTSWSIVVRACSTAVELGEPSAGTWLRRGRAGAAAAASATVDPAVGEPLPSGVPFVIVIVSGPPWRPFRHPRISPIGSRKRQNPRLPARVPLVPGGAPRYLRDPPFSRREPVISPRRPSSPRRSERRRARGDTKSKPESTGTYTRRPSVVTTTATRRRSWPLNRPKSDSEFERSRQPRIERCSGSLPAFADYATTSTSPNRTPPGWPEEWRRHAANRPAPQRTAARHPSRTIGSSTPGRTWKRPPVSPAVVSRQWWKPETSLA